MKREVIETSYNFEFIQNGHTILMRSFDIFETTKNRLG